MMAKQKNIFSGLSLAPYGHVGFTVSLKPSLNLRPFKWVNCSFKRDNNFTHELYIKNFLVFEL